MRCISDNKKIGSLHKFPSLERSCPGLGEAELSAYWLAFIILAMVGTILLGHRVEHFEVHGLSDVRDNAGYISTCVFVSLSDPLVVPI